MKEEIYAIAALTIKNSSPISFTLNSEEEIEKLIEIVQKTKDLSLVHPKEPSQRIVWTDHAALIIRYNVEKEEKSRQIFWSFID